MPIDHLLMWTKQKITQLQRSLESQYRNLFALPHHQQEIVEKPNVLLVAVFFLCSVLSLKKPSRSTHKNRRIEQNKNYDFNNLETYIFRLFSFLPAHSLSSYVLIFFLFLILFYSILSVISWASQSQTLMMLHHSENEHQANTREEKKKNRLELK